MCRFSANPQAPAHSDVGVDAHIDPAECTDFMEIYGEFVTSQRADVGIGPYSQIGKCLRIRRKTSASRPCPLPDLSGAPRQLPFARGAWGRAHAQKPGPSGPGFGGLLGGSIREQRGGEIAVAGVGEEDDDGLALVFRALGELDGCVERCAGCLCGLRDGEGALRFPGFSSPARACKAPDAAAAAGCRCSRTSRKRPAL